MTSAQLTPVEGIRRHLQRGIRGYVTGHENPPRRSPAIDGWFGPDSITWLVQSDWSMVIGGVQALLVQTLHPQTMAAVADHSDYERDLFGRLHRTVEFLGVTTWGSAEEAERAVARVRSIHDGVTGTTPDGEPYRANDPRNLAWIHATEVDAFLRSYRRFGLEQINDDEADRYVAEMARVGEALGVVAAPRSVRELDETLQSYLAELRYGPQARRAVRLLLFPPHGWAARAPYAIVLSAAVSNLPPWARRKLWLPPTIRPVSDLFVEPAARALTKTLNWIMEPPEEVARIRAQRQG